MVGVLTTTLFEGFCSKFVNYHKVTDVLFWVKGIVPGTPRDGRVNGERGESKDRYEKCGVRR